MLSDLLGASLSKSDCMRSFFSYKIRLLLPEKENICTQEKILSLRQMKILS